MVVADDLELTAMRVTKRLTMKHGWLASLLACTLLTAACNGPSQAARPGASADANSPDASPSAAPANSPSVAPGAASAISILSVLSVEHEVDVLAQHEGLVTALNADVGSSVHEGATLAQLDDGILRAELDRARSNLAFYEDNVKYNEAEAKAKNAAYRRQLELQKDGLTSDAQVEQAEFESKGEQYDLESAQAQVKRTQDEIRLAELEIQKMKIQAPFGGVITMRYIHPGQDVLKDEKCFRLSQLSPLRVQFLVPETAAQPRAGMEVAVSLASGSAANYTARVERVSPTVDPASGGYDVIAQLTGRNLSELRPGMSVRVQWPAQPASK
jgi:RND family efflux transporter MFP subunit